jgi:HSP20 family protein
MADREPPSAQRQLFFRQQAERIFQDFLRPEGARPGDPGALRVAADVFEDGEQVVVEVELPGVSRDDVALYVLRDRLIIEGVKPEGRQPGPAAGDLAEGGPGSRPSFVCAERHFGAFERVVQLEVPVDTSRIEARLNSGLLVVTLPKILDRRGKKRRVDID